MFMNRNIFTAIALLLTGLGLSGNAAADFKEVATAYARGDYVTALREWRQLAAAGDARAQFNLGLMHEKAKGVRRDMGRAGEWYRRAAEQGHMLAQTNLGKMYFLGDGVEENYVEAAKLLRQAAHQGVGPAQFFIGMIYVGGGGGGIHSDPVQAYKWLTLAQSFRGSQYREDVNSSRDTLAKGMTLAQIAEGERLAREWMTAFEREKMK